MGPDEHGFRGLRTAAQRQAETDARLAAVQAEFPGWDILQVFGGWEAVPAGTTVVRSSDLGGLADKLRSRD